MCARHATTSRQQLRTVRKLVWDANNWRPDPEEKRLKRKSYKLLRCQVLALCAVAGRGLGTVGPSRVAEKKCRFLRWSKVPTHQHKQNTLRDDIRRRSTGHQIDDRANQNSIPFGRPSCACFGDWACVCVCVYIELWMRCHALAVVIRVIIGLTVACTCLYTIHLPAKYNEPRHMRFFLPPFTYPVPIAATTNDAILTFVRSYERQIVRYKSFASIVQSFIAAISVVPLPTHSQIHPIHLLIQHQLNSSFVRIFCCCHFSPVFFSSSLAPVA